MVETVLRRAAYIFIDSLNAIEGDLVRIRFVGTLLALLVFSIMAVGALTACGSSSTPSKARTPTATTAQNSDGCAPGKTIPQGGGDNDGDNSGGPSDGDGCM